MAWMDRISISGFLPHPHSGKISVEAINLAKSYGEKVVLTDLNFAIEKGEFIAFVGRNGEGKSTLARIIVGDLDFEGIARTGTQCQNRILCPKSGHDVRP